MISRTKPLKIKELLSEKLNIGKSRIRFNDKTWILLRDANVNDVSRALVNKLIETSSFRIIPKKKRPYKIYYGKIKQSTVNKRDRIKPINKESYLLRRKIITPKKIWIKKIREIRSYLKKNKSTLGVKKYRDLRNKAKGNVYKSLRDLTSKI